MGLSRSGVLQSQDWPISWRSTITQFIHLLACLCERHRFLICISNERNRVIIVFVETQRAWIAIPLREWTKKKKHYCWMKIFILRFRFCFRKFMRKWRNNVKTCRRCDRFMKCWRKEPYHNWWSTDSCYFQAQISSGHRDQIRERKREIWLKKLIQSQILFRAKSFVF